MDKISEHISFAEATKSQQAVRMGIPNLPNDFQIHSMKLLAENVFEPLRLHFGKPIAISSFFRTYRINAIIGGAPNSQHTLGQAMDIDADIFGGLTNKQIYDYIKTNLDFDQLIWEFGNDANPDWVHVSYISSKANRKQLLRATIVHGKTQYMVLK